MLLFFQYVINGILVGGVYALLGLGIVLIYKSTKVFNFAIGEMVLLGGFFLYSFFNNLKVPLVFALPLTLLVSLLTGFFIEYLTLRPLIGQPILTVIMATLALSLILTGVIYSCWGSYEFAFPQKILPYKTFLFGEVFLPQDMLSIFLISMAAFIILWLFIKFSKIGFFMRATAESHDTAQAIGINVGRIFSISWGITGMIAAIAGILLGDRLGLGVAYIPGMALRAFPAILFGGLESIGGTLIGGLIVGILESLAGGYITPKLSEITPYIVLLLVLLFRPEGLFGLKKIERI